MGSKAKLTQSHANYRVTQFLDKVTWRHVNLTGSLRKFVVLVIFESIYAKAILYTRISIEPQPLPLGNVHAHPSHTETTHVPISYVRPLPIEPDFELFPLYTISFHACYIMPIVEHPIPFPIRPGPSSYYEV